MQELQTKKISGMGIVVSYLVRFYFLYPLVFKYVPSPPQNLNLEYVPKQEFGNERKNQFLFFQYKLPSPCLGVLVVKMNIIFVVLVVLVVEN